MGRKVQLPLWVGFVITVASFFCGLLFVLLDYVFIVNHRRRRVENSVREGSINGVKTPLLESLRDNKEEMDSVRKIIILLVIADKAFATPISQFACFFLFYSCQETYSKVLKALDSSDTKSETLSFKDLKDLDHRFWLLTLSCVVTYCSVLPFNNIASDLLQDRYDYK